MSNILFKPYVLMNPILFPENIYEGIITNHSFSFRRHLNPVNRTRPVFSAILMIMASVDRSNRTRASQR